MPLSHIKLYFILRFEDYGFKILSAKQLRREGQEVKLFQHVVLILFRTILCTQHKSVLVAK